eukprot:COSAG06_NODE_24213_length_669_cov_1.050877_1_plen_25_part_10
MYILLYNIRFYFVLHVARRPRELHA